jgi:hypothetical protein
MTAMGHKRTAFRDWPERSGEPGLQRVMVHSRLSGMLMKSGQAPDRPGIEGGGFPA